MHSSRRWLCPVFILILALALRLVGAAWWQARLPADQTFYFGDSVSYWDLASDIVAGRDYEYQGSRIFRTPGYPLILAPLFMMWRGGPPIFAARAWNALWGTAAVGGVMLLARIHFEERTANVAGLCAAILPEAIAGSVFVLSEAAFVPLMIAHLILASLARQTTTFKSCGLLSVGSGIVGGLATLVRPSWLLFLPLLALFQALACGGDASLRRRLSLAFLPLMACALVMSPWWLRNYSLSGSFVPTSTEVGSSLYDGLNPRADGSSNMDFKPDLDARFAASDNAAADEKPAAREVRLDHFYRQQALAWAQANPSAVCELAGIKFLRLWNVFPNAADFRSTTGRWLIAVSYAPLIILAAAGCFVCFRSADTSAPLLLLLPAVYLTTLHMLFVSSLRYRLPALLPLLIFSAVAAGWLYDYCIHLRNPAATTRTDTT